MNTQHSKHRTDKSAHHWREANREAITASNDWVEAEGLPLQAQRLF